MAPHLAFLNTNRFKPDRETVESPLWRRMVLCQGSNPERTAPQAGGFWDLDRISIIWTLVYPNTIVNIKNPYNYLIFCKTK